MPPFLTRTAAEFGLFFILLLSNFSFFQVRPMGRLPTAAEAAFLVLISCGCMAPWLVYGAMSSNTTVYGTLLTALITAIVMFADYRHGLILAPWQYATLGLAIIVLIIANLVLTQPHITPRLGQAIFCAIGFGFILIGLLAFQPLKAATTLPQPLVPL